MKNKPDSFTIGLALFVYFILSSIYTIHHFINETPVKLKMVASPLIFFTLASAFFILSAVLKIGKNRKEKVKNLVAFVVVFLFGNILNVIVINYINGSFKLYLASDVIIFCMFGILMLTIRFIKKGFTIK